MPLLHVRSQKVLVDREEGRCVGIRESSGREADEQASAAGGLAGLVGDIGHSAVVVIHASWVEERWIGRRSAAWPREGLRDEKWRVKSGTRIGIWAVFLAAIENAVASSSNGFVIDLESQANAGSEVLPVCRDETLAASGAECDPTSNEWG